MVLLTFRNSCWSRDTKGPINYQQRTRTSGTDDTVSGTACRGRTVRRQSGPFIRLVTKVHSGRLEDLLRSGENHQRHTTRDL